MHIQNLAIRVSKVALLSIVLGCGPSASQPSRPVTNVPSDPVATVPVEQGVAPKSSDAPAPVQPSNTAEQALVSSDAVAENAKISVPPVATAQAIPPVASKPKIEQPTAEQLARWSQPEQEPLQLLSFRDGSKAGFVEKLACLPSGRMFLLAGTKVTLWSIDGTEPEHVFLDMATSGKETSIKSLAVAPNGKWFAAGDSEGLLKVWSMSDRKEVHSKKIFQTGITKIAISPDGQEIAMISYDVDVAIYQSSTLEKKNQFKINSTHLADRHHSYPPNEVGRVEKRAIKRVFRGGRVSTA